jgi:hypothetical protein
MNYTISYSLQLAEASEEGQGPRRAVDDDDDDFIFTPLYMSMGWEWVSELRPPSGLLFILQISVYQNVVRDGSSSGLRRSAGGFGRKKIANIISDTKRVENTPIHVCAKTAYASLSIGIMFLVFTYMHFRALGILRMLSACAPTAYEVVSDYRKFEKTLVQIYICMEHSRMILTEKNRRT